MNGEQQHLICGAHIKIEICHVAEVGLDEEALALVVRGLRFGQRDRDVGVGTFEYLFAREVAAIRNDIEFVGAEDLHGFL